MQRRSALSSAVVLACTSTPAYAHGEAIVIAILLWVGLFGGAVAGALEAVNPWKKLGPFRWFGIHLGVIALGAAIAAGTLEVIPYAIGYGAFFGVVPFVLLFYLFRYLGSTIRACRASQHQRAQK